jgi:hypothetical protein
MGSLVRQMALSPAVSKTSADYQQMLHTQFTALFRLVTSVGKNGFRRGVDEETNKKMVQSILAEYIDRLSPDTDEDALSLMFRTAVEQIRQLAKQVMIRNMIGFSQYLRNFALQGPQGSCCNDPSDCHLMMPRHD